MSARLVQLGLLSLVSTALAAPVAPSGGLTYPDMASAIGTHSHFHKHGKANQTMEAIATATAWTTTMTTVYVDATGAAMSSAAAPAAADAAPASVASVASPAAADMAPASSASVALSNKKPTQAAWNSPAASQANPVASVASVVASAATSMTPTTTGSSTGTYSGGSSGAKGGVAYTDAASVSPFVGQSNIGWCYNWNAAPGNIASGVEYIPLLWGTQSTFTGSWVSDANSAISKGATAVMGFNEPDHPQQANLAAGTAATAYKQYITDNFSGKATLVAPSVTNGGAPMGLTYLSSFMSACSDCGIQAINLHWYDVSSNTDYFKSYIQGAYQQFNLPIWLTEFGTTDGNDQAFLEAVLPWLEEQTYVEKYAYFMAENGKLLSGSQLSAAGQTYASA